jgi:hypothetical protein
MFRTRCCNSANSTPWCSVTIPDQLKFAVPRPILEEIAEMPLAIAKHRIFRFDCRQAILELVHCPIIGHATSCIVCAHKYS